MMFARCNELWNRDDFSGCFQEDVLQVILPLIAAASSLLYILSTCIYEHSRRRGSADAEPTNVLGADDPRRYRDDPLAEHIFPLSGEDLADPDDATSKDVSTSKSPRVEWNRPRGQILSVLIEILAVVLLIALTLLSLTHRRWNIRSQLANYAELATWCYVLVLTLTRLLTTKAAPILLPSLWYQTAWLYTIQWIVSAVLFRSALIHPRSEQARVIMVTQFCFNSVLFFISLTSRRGNKTVVLYYEGDLEPSPEPLANLISTWTYSWVDRMIWKGYKKTLELTDTWNLEAQDKATAVLADFRQLRKTSSLAFHLLKYFKKEIIQQSLWAILSGLFTFAPTLLMKAFLEYVENPADIPTNAAWLYISLLAISSCIKSITDGQALWIGRKICIRLRAIIVGEIYAKALRRKAATGRSTVLGEKSPKTDHGDKTVNDSRSTEPETAKDQFSQADSKDSQVNVGTIINLMAVDSFKVSEISAYLHFLWGSTPVQLIVCIFLLYQILGRSSLAGIVLMAMVLPMNLWIAKQFTKVQKRVMAATDIRIHSTNEVLQNIRIIKYFAWEQRFSHIVDDKRHTELMALRKKYILWTAAAGIWFGVPLLITFFSFLLYTVVEQKPLYPSVAFTALSLFGILRYPLDQLADMIAHIQESRVSVDRVEEFLAEDETEKYDQLKLVASEIPSGDTIIGFDNATLSWGQKDSGQSERTSPFQMINLKVRFVPGRLNIIAGPTGSGKTSMLMALLGEMTLIAGRVRLPYGGSRDDLSPHPQSGLIESAAYCAQQAWLINNTIKENILFFSPLDEGRYQLVIEACALSRDLEIFDAGDSTLVGEKGITLSGGQKQRISLARALYSKARHVLLDDCLSAVDSHTAKHIFEHCVLGPLMLNRTCILVTHNVGLCVPASQFVVVLSNGKVAAQGLPDTVIQSGALGEEILKSRPGSKLTSQAHSRIPSEISLNFRENGNANHHGSTKSGANGSALKVSGKQSGENAAPRTEGKATGSVNLKVILLYMQAMGPWYYWLIALVAFTMQQLGSVGANVWIKTWANRYLAQDFASSSEVKNAPKRLHLTHGMSLSSSAQPVNGPFWNLQSYSRKLDRLNVLDTTVPVDAWYYLAIYSLLAVVFIVVSLWREWLIFLGSLRASKRIHTKLLGSVLRARLLFFDITPLGQLMNRFSKDIEAVDQDISPIAVGVIGCLFSLISIIVLICVITPGFIIAGFFIAFLYFAIGRFYISSSRDLKRIESVQRSPIYQQFGETLSGVVTIRAYGDERRFMSNNQNRVDTHNRPFILLWATNRWLAFRVDLAGALVAFFAGTFIILGINHIDAGLAGLSLTYAVMFTENMLWLVRLYSANEQNMNSVERIKEYMDVEQEAKAIVEDFRPPKHWPSKGGIKIEHYTTRYRTGLEPVLRDLTFDVLPGERVGIVGRTGAGKSSLALALFRGLEADDGRILIDGIDIGQIGLQDLREAITIVPQDPTLFTGTVRSNLDPFGLFTDEEVFAALRRVQLIGTSGSRVDSESNSPAPPVTLTPPDTPESTSSSNTIPNDELDLAKTITNSRENANIFTDLSSPIAESGSNLSQGQRQLLCLARALLKNPRVLVMDEATASIDYNTDNKLQHTLREVRDSTIITIAHRLQTIVDYDKILVLEKGERVEYDSPWTLIQKPDGIFRGMCEMSGDFDTLLQTALEAGRQKQLVDL